MEAPVYYLRMFGRLFNRRINRRRKDFCRSLIAVVFLGLVSNGAGQTAELPLLAQIKAAAERGDAQAQDKLGDAYYGRYDTVTALVWYRKAAGQGIVNSQYYAARLLMRRGTDYSGKIVSASDVDEAVKLYFRAAGQWHSLAQLEVAQMYESGKLVKQDYVEAYKWFALASKNGIYSLTAKSNLDRLILKLSQEQITEGQRRVNQYLNAPRAVEKIPESPLVDRIKLNGVIGSEKHWVALIQGHTFESGEEAYVKIDDRQFKVRCLEIHKDSARVTIEGVEGAKELRLK